MHPCPLEFPSSSSLARTFFPFFPAVSADHDCLMATRTCLTVQCCMSSACCLSVFLFGKHVNILGWLVSSVDSASAGYE